MSTNTRRLLSDPFDIIFAEQQVYQSAARTDGPGIKTTNSTTTTTSSGQKIAHFVQSGGLRKVCARTL